MSTRSKRRRSSARLYETEPNIKQTRYPSPRRMIKDKHPAWSSPRRHQQTITQMNPFRTIFHPESEAEDLYSDEGEPESYVASPVGRKRRKITPEKPVVRKIETRSAARKLVPQEPELPKVDNLANAPRKMAEPKDLQSPTSLMPPPKTPQTFRKKEIPSSQSPADSPLSIQSRRPARYTRTPLKERSTNSLPSSSTPRKLPRWARKLEVADSMENEENESPIMTPTRASKKEHGHTDVPSGERVLMESSQLRLEVPASRVGTAKEAPEYSQEQTLESRATGRTKVHVVFDSDTEYDEEENEDERQVGCDSGVHTNNRRTPTPTVMQEYSSPTTRPLDTSSLSNPSVDDSSIAKEPHPDPNLASAQLFSDLHRATTTAPTGGLQTESQFENAFIPYQPPSTTALSSSPLPNPSSPMDNHPSPLRSKPSQPLHETVRTQLLSPSKTPFQHSRPIPPSQATTTDLTQTQPSPRKIPSSSSSSLAMPSSPPPMPPPLPSSSPSMQRRKAKDLWAGFKWDGRRLTDSQLLPESLVNDSFGVGGPPNEGLELTDENDE